MALAPEKTIYDEFTDFIGSAPSLERIATYRLPQVFQDRAQELLRKNRMGALSESEQQEMATYREADHLITLTKAKAKLYLKEQS